MLLIFWYILEFLILYNHTLLQHCWLYWASYFLSPCDLRTYALHNCGFAPSPFHSHTTHTPFIVTWLCLLSFNLSLTRAPSITTRTWSVHGSSRAVSSLTCYTRLVSYAGARWSREPTGPARSLATWLGNQFPEFESPICDQVILSRGLYSVS
jgi:hypothetical protein